MTSSDKDFRFMATNDLMSELQKDSIKLDDDSERKVVRMLLRLLEDKNGEVQNLAVRCLGPLVGKVKDYQVRTRSCRLISISIQRSCSQHYRAKIPFFSASAPKGPVCLFLGGGDR